MDRREDQVLAADAEREAAGDRPAAAAPDDPSAASAEAVEATEPEQVAEAVAPPPPPVPTPEQQRDEYLAIAQRAQADFDNYRKRAARDVAAASARAKTGLLRDLLPVVDNLERALASAGPADGALAGGVGLVHAELLGVLRRAGAQPIEPRGEPFDPTVHEAISTAPADGAQPGLVVEVVEKGYSLGDAVIRPARVVVSA